MTEADTVCDVRCDAEGQRMDGRSPSNHEHQPARMLASLILDLDMPPLSSS